MNKIHNWISLNVSSLYCLNWRLFCKEIKPVNPEGNQLWIFIERSDAEAETPVLWPPDAKNRLIWKDPDAGKDQRQKEKRMTEDEMVGLHHWHDGHEFEQALGVGDGRPVCCSPWSQQRVGHNWATELNWTQNLNFLPPCLILIKRLSWIFDFSNFTCS